MFANNNDLSISINENLLGLIASIKECSSFFQSGQIAEGLGLLAEMTEDISRVINMAVNLMIVEESKIEEINIKLNGIVRAIENEDFIMVGDIMEYEILNDMKLIQEKLQ